MCLNILLVPFFFCLLLWALWRCGPFGRFVVLSVGLCVIGSCFISEGCLPADQYGYGYPYPESIQNMIDWGEVAEEDVPLEPEAQRRWYESRTEHLLPWNSDQ